MSWGSQMPESELFCLRCREEGRREGAAGLREDNFEGEKCL